jgi:hypothetical protein
VPRWERDRIVPAHQKVIRERALTARAALPACGRSTTTVGSASGAVNYNEPTRREVIRL